MNLPLKLILNHIHYIKIEILYKLAFFYVLMVLMFVILSSMPNLKMYAKNKYISMFIFLKIDYFNCNFFTKVTFPFLHLKQLRKLSELNINNC